MGELSKLPNIGAVVEEQLHQAGIMTEKQLKEIGSAQAWLKIQEMDSSACIHRLYSLEGAIQGVPKNQLAPEVKAELKACYNAHKINKERK